MVRLFKGQHLIEGHHLCLVQEGGEEQYHFEGHRLCLVHGVGDGLHHRSDVEAVARKVGTIFKAAGAPDRMSLQWGAGGHRFYPKLMWPFIEGALGE